MKLKSYLALFASLSLLTAAACQKAPEAASPDSAAYVLKTFQDPPSGFRSAPLWVWNDRITERQIEDQMADFKAHGIGGVFVHPRPGLITPYLSQEWLSLFRHAVDVGKKLDMKVWIYDENSYPSGFAGGHVPAQMPEATRAGLRLVKAETLPASFETEPLVVLKKAASGFEDITAQARSGGRSLGRGEYYIFDVNKQKPNPWYGGYAYVDLMRREVTQKFLAVTLDAYKSVAGDEFGGVVPGSFQDEAEINPAGGRDITVVNYTPALFDRFQAKWSYDLRIHLPSLYDDVGEWARVRHDFYATLLDLFIEGWARPYYEYAARNKLAFTGHYWEHEWPRPVVNPDNLAFASYSHMPGIDILMNDFQTDTHAQFGNARSVKEIRSAANQTGAKRTMSETFGASGWDLTFFDQKRIADWEYALGVNFMNQHLSYVTIMGARKRDHPQSFSYHEPWWPSYKILADYFGRLSAALSAGEQMNRVLILEPTTTGWLFQSARGETEAMRALGRDFQDFVNRLEENQVEYDLGSEFTLKESGKVEAEKMVLGRRAYDLVVLPPGMQNLESPTLALLEALASKGGMILSGPIPPVYVDGKADDRPVKLAEARPDAWRRSSRETWVEDILKIVPPVLGFQKKAGPSPDLLFHHRRTLADGELVFLANTSRETITAGTMTAPASSCEAWNLFTGQAESYPFEIDGGRLRVDYDIPPGGSLLLCLKPGKAKAASRPGFREEIAQARTPLAVRRDAPNILTLDYCDLTLGGKTEKDLYFYDAQLRTFRHHGLDRNPWDSAVQYETNILDKDKFAPDSGFTATFRFPVAEGIPPASLRAVVERPHLFRVSVNGRPVEPLKDAWWLDRAFGVFEIGPLLKPGENAVTLAAKPFTIHSELEPIYILGEFGVESAAKGFKLVPAGPLGLGAWNGQGLPLYSGTVTYAKSYDLGQVDGSRDRIFVELGAWAGSVAEVFVNGKAAGCIAFAPFRLDVTSFLAAGTNEVSVAVCGTLKNTLGPFHNEPALGRAWPGSFQQGAKGGFPPGSKYSLVGYGLFEEFKLIRRAATSD